MSDGQQYPSPRVELPDGTEVPMTHDGKAWVSDPIDLDSAVDKDVELSLYWIVGDSIMCCHVDLYGRRCDNAMLRRVATEKRRRKRRAAKIEARLTPQQRAFLRGSYGFNDLTPDTDFAALKKRAADALARLGPGDIGLREMAPKANSR